MYAFQRQSASNHDDLLGCASPRRVRGNDRGADDSRGGRAAAARSSACL